MTEDKKNKQYLINPIFRSIGAMACLGAGVNPASLQLALINAAFDGGVGRDYPHILQPIFGNVLHGRLDDTDDGDGWKFLAEDIRTQGADGIAGDEDHLHILMRQKLHNLDSKPYDCVPGLVAIRRTGCVAEINHIFVRHPLTDCFYTA